MIEDKNIPIHIIGIEDIKMSVRSYNCLKRNNIHTIDEFMNIKECDLSKFKNMGEKSLKEVIEIKLNLSNNFNVSFFNVIEPKVKDKIYYDCGKICSFDFYNKYGKMVQDLHIDDLNLSIRATNCLINENIEFASQLMEMEYEKFVKIKNIGKKTIDEIIIKLKKKCLPIYYNDDFSSENEKLKTYLTPLINDMNIYFNVLISKEIINQLNKIMNENIEMYDLDGDVIYCELMDKAILNSKDVKSIIKKNCILNMFKDNKMISRYSIETHLPTKFANKILVDKLIEELVLEKSIECVNGEFRKYSPNIIDFIQTIDNIHYRNVITLRLSGLSLEEVSKKLEIKITRERVRQIFNKGLQYKPFLDEDYYKDCFEKFDIPKSDFKNLFEINELSYNYLDIFYIKGSQPFITILDDENFTRKTRKRAEELLSKNFLFVNNNRLYKTRDIFLTYVLKEYSSDGVEMEDFKYIYNEFLKENCIIEENFKFTERYFEVALSKNKNVLWKYKKKLRYYDIEAYDINYFINKLNLNNYNNVEISSLKIFLDNFDLMTQYDIRDEYELHNLLKKNLKNSNELNIEFGRMPFIQFGNINRDIQVFDMLLLTAPISNYDFAKEYEKEYGVQYKTVLANFLYCIDEYLHNGMFNIEYKNLNEEEYSYMEKKLKKDFYLISEVKNIYREKYPYGEIDLINSFNMKILGYKVFSNYIISKKYITVDSYIKECLTKDDLININDFKAVTSILSFYIKIQELRNNLEIIEYASYKYINIRKLKYKGIYKHHLEKYINNVIEFANDKYFTIKYLNHLGFSSELEELGLDDFFCASLIKTNSNIRFVRISRTFIFKVSFTPIKILDFFIYLFGKLRSMDIYDFINYLKDSYDIVYNKSKIITLVSNSSLYYSSIMEKIYIDYDEYYEEF